MHSLRIRFLLAVIAVVVIPLSVFSWISIDITRDFLDAEGRQQLSIMRRAVEHELQESRSDLLLHANGIASEIKLKEYFRQGDRQNVLAYLQGIQSLIKTHEISIIDTHGIIFAQTHLPSEFGTFFTFNQAFKDALEGEDQDGHRLSGQGISSVVKAPLFMGDRPLGIVYLVRHLDYPFLRAVSQKLGVDLILYNGNKIQAATVKDVAVFRDPQLKRLVAEENASKIEYIHDLKMLASSVPIKTREGEYLGSLLCLHSTEANEQLSSTLSLWFVGIAVLLFVAASTVVVFLARSVTNPVNTLLSAINKLGKGDMTAEVPVKGRNELSELSTGFNQMADRLRKTTASVDDLNLEVQSRREAELKSARLGQELQGVIDALPSMIVSISNDLTITGLNHRAKDELGSEGVLNAPLCEVVPRIGGYKKEIKSAVHKGESFEVTELVSDLHDKDRVENVAILALKDERRSFGAVIRFDDITDKLMIQEQLHQSEKMNAIGQMAGGIAHDFNNQLQVIGSASALLGFRLQADEDKKLLQMISAASERSAKLTGQLLAFSRQGPGELSAINLNNVLNEVETLFNRTIDRRVIIRSQYLDRELPINGDSSLLENAFLNLLINARDAISNNGVISIRSSICHLNADDILDYHGDNLTPGTYALAEVHDTGTGMPEDVLERIFEPFFSTKGAQGTGLGLAAVHGTIMQHVGGIRVQSKVGRGSTFSIVLPLIGHVDATDESAQLPVIGEDAPRVLLVDDEERALVTVHQLLVQLGYQVTSFSDPRLIPDWYEDNWRDIDVVLFDLNMPYLNGADLYRELAAINQDVVGILATGYGEQRYIERVMSLGVKTILRKPYGVKDLQQAFEEVVT